MIRDVVVLVPDKDIEQAVRGLLNRPEALGVRSIDYELVVHPNHDPGCYHTGHQLLTLYARECRHALVVFDRAWGGAPTLDPAGLAGAVEVNLAPVWGNRARCVVIDPEVEIWVWSDSPHVASVLGWEGRDPPLRRWLEQGGLWPSGQTKPSDPKRAFERALRAANLASSPALFRQLADRVSLERCTDPSFRALRGVLHGWFGS